MCALERYVYHIWGIARPPLDSSRSSVQSTCSCVLHTQVLLTCVNVCVYLINLYLFNGMYQLLKHHNRSTLNFIYRYTALYMLF